MRQEHHALPRHHDIDGGELLELRCTDDDIRRLVADDALVKPERREQAQLFGLVRARLLELLSGYVQAPALLESVDTYVVPPALGKHAGILGGIALAQRELPGSA